MKKLFIFLLIIFGEIILAYEIAYRERVYPGISIQGVNFGNWTQDEVENFFVQKNQSFHQTQFNFSFEEKAATISGEELRWGLQPEKMAEQIYQLGRNYSLLVNVRTKIKAFFHGITLAPLYSFDEKKLEEVLARFNQEVYRPPKNALFQFKDGRVIVFQPEEEGFTLDLEKAVAEIKEKVGQSSGLIKIDLISQPIKPEITMELANNLGVWQLLGRGVSYFGGSPAPRIHNINLATSSLNGQLIKPGEIFSFNQTLGDASLKTGYQQALIIKEGRTILGDGGGVCQVSTTLFRAVLNAGLPILERQAHSYRVGYYEQGGFGPGLDATVFYPSVDLKFQNDTPAYLLIQAFADNNSKALTFELYGSNDGRTVTVSPPKIWERLAPPEDLYQDDSGLTIGVIKQVEKSIWGAKVSFNWEVKRNGEIIHQKTFFSLYKPWQAVYLKGIGP